LDYLNLLTQPIPNLGEARQKKRDYRSFPINRAHSLCNEELVAAHAYGLAGQAYYSRSNAATGNAVEHVSKEPYLRKSLAEKLQKINTRLSAPEITDFFDGAVELYIEDAYRSYALQHHLRTEVFPELIRTQNPGISNNALQKKLNNLIAEPTKDEKSPSPHATGGAVDIVLRYKQKTFDFVKDAKVFFGNGDADTSEAVFPDYYEHHTITGEAMQKAQMNRRAFYALMTGVAYGDPTGLQINPTEWWHWSYGDQMWAKLSGKPAAFYSFTESRK
jgi:zinc D-Ala-D-Ala dipeptidase